MLDGIPAVFSATFSVLELLTGLIGAGALVTGTGGGEIATISSTAGISVSMPKSTGIGVAIKPILISKAITGFNIVLNVEAMKLIIT